MSVIEPSNVDRLGPLRRAGPILLWYVVPAFALVGVVAYILGATVGHANPPIVPVQGVSMRPMLQAGDLIVLTGVDPAKLRKGDIVAVNVPKDARSQYGLPGQIVHRIVRIEHDAGGLLFITKGDANSGADVFTTRPGDIVGKLKYDIPGAGYPFIFFRSRQGEIFLGVAGLVALIYFVLGLFEERRAYVEGSVLTMQTVLAETQELKRAIASAERLASVDDTLVLERSTAPSAFDRLAEEVHASSARGERSDDTMRELVGAISEYGRHLRSHTEVMKNLAATTSELRLAVTEMRAGVVERVEPGPFVTAGLDRLLAETAALVDETSRRREELRRAIAGR